MNNNSKQKKNQAINLLNLMYFLLSRIQMASAILYVFYPAHAYYGPITVQDHPGGCPTELAPKLPPNMAKNNQDCELSFWFPRWRQGPGREDGGWSRWWMMQGRRERERDKEEKGCQIPLSPLWGPRAGCSTMRPVGMRIILS